MKKLIKCIGTIFAFCMGLGLAVGAIEKKRGKVGWVEGHKPYGFYEENLKRPLDFGLSLFALVILWPVMLFTAALVRLKLGKPVLFRQERPGLGGRIFTIRKFRTMTDKRDANGELLPDEARLTGFGKMLRSTSLDELPELFNILKGDMSIVGPRPLLVDYLPRYSREQRRRHEVLPGLTGLSQSRGRNARTWEERFRDDVEYVDRVTFLGDLKILLDTVGIVLRKNGVSSATSVTMEAFEGSREIVI